MPHALLVEDDERFLQPLTAMAEQQGYSSSCARSLREARCLLERSGTDVLLLDTSLPDGSGLKLLEDPEQENLGEVIVMSEDPDVESVVAALRKQVRDYLTKPVDLARVQNHLETLARNGSPAPRSRQPQRSQPRSAPRPDGGPMLGNSPAMCEVYQMVARVAPTSATVLLIGESGTGKELAARAIHDRSHRRGQPMIPLNCGAIPENLIESELFGHEKGAFTGAGQTRRGVFERATGGTLFLDEITEMPLDLQVRLLRALETSQITRVGGERPIDIDVRVIAATNRDPYEAAEDGRLREDLLYRLMVFPIELPPLRQREGDIELLAHHFLAQLNQETRQNKRFAPETVNRLKSCAWPGNVRQLRNIVQRMHILADGEIAPDDLPARLAARSAETRHGELQFPVGTSLAEAEKQIIFATLKRYDGDKRQTAHTLGVSLKTLYNRLNAYKTQGEEIEV
ncbi:MAG: sigma-54-dependent transcriptional regulator [Phycisphaeraceae bacterium]